MSTYLDFKTASCKNCYKCLRSCPVKAIAVINHQAKIIDERCILCGTCTHVCPQNAKHVHNNVSEVMDLLSCGGRVIASVAPSFVSSFAVKDFAVMRKALMSLGFFGAEETADGANLVVQEYERLLKTKKYKNFITSACPAVNSMIQLYYPKALEFLAPVDSPMLAHAKLLRKDNPESKIVFIGPCIAKKKEAAQSGIVDASLTYEDLAEIFEKNNIKLDEIQVTPDEEKSVYTNKAKYFPISRGIIKSFITLPAAYEYVAIDGVQKCMDILDNIDSLSGMFLELNACDYACVNGPCSLTAKGEAIKANQEIRSYVNKDLSEHHAFGKLDGNGVIIDTLYPRINVGETEVSERVIKEILAKTGKTKPEDELNCGACGYATCREKAWAVANGYAEVEMCLPYMRERAETMAYEILKNSPNGTIVLDNDCKVIEMNNKAVLMLGADSLNVRGRDLVDFINPTDFILARIAGKQVVRKKIFIEKTQIFVDMTIIIQSENGVMFGFLADVTEQTNYDEKLAKVRADTIATTDQVIKKQMRVAQEIASLLGETTAETKVTLLKLKKVLSEAENGKGEI